jgi:hypothetical protein
MPQTPFFREFGPLLFGRVKQKVQKIAQAEKSLEGLYGCFGDLVPGDYLRPTDKGNGSRERKLPLSVTFWAFLSQVLDAGCACREVVRKIEAWWRWEQCRQGSTLTTSAYCQARARLPETMLELVLQHTNWQLERNILNEERWLKGKRPVKIIDGTMISMPDTPSNQSLWPQSGGQQPGCGFPMLRLVSVFSLDSGALLHHAIGNKHQHETTVFSELHHTVKRGDIYVADRAYSSYELITMFTRKGADMVTRLHQARKCDLRQGKRLGPGERLITLAKPSTKPAHSRANDEEYQAWPEEVMLRIIKVEVTVPGFRTRSALVVTTLLDRDAYPADEIRELYRRRWQVELHYAQIKTTLGMDILRTRSPEMVRKELLVHLIAYNLIRALIQKAAHIHHVALHRLSFKGTVDSLRHYAHAIRAASATPKKKAQLINQLLERIAGDQVPDRPNRSEPRALKRRGKNFQLLTVHRSKMKPKSHRNNYRKSRPKSPLS